MAMALVRMPILKLFRIILWTCVQKGTSAFNIVEWKECPGIGDYIEQYVDRYILSARFFAVYHRVSS